MNIILIGFQNSGKTTIGKMLAKKMQRKFIDTDYLLMQAYENKFTPKQIYQKAGEHCFRILEKNIIINLKVDNTIIATGGGSLLNTTSRNHLKNLGKLIYLYTSSEILFTRSQSPAFLDKNNLYADFMNQYQMRHHLYEAAADFKICTDNKPFNMILKEILQDKKWQVIHSDNSFV